MIEKARQLEVQNARIASTRLGYLDGHFSFFLDLDYGGSGQGFGGIVLNESFPKLLSKILGVAGVKTWEELPGRYVRACGTWDHVGALAPIIGGDWIFLTTADEEKGVPNEWR